MYAIRLILNMRRRLLEECSCTSEFINCVAGDICLVDNNTLDKLIIEVGNYNLESFPSEKYTPIGVVVVPSSHTDDCTARIISLASMDYNNPEAGSTDGHVGIAWGGYNSDISTLKNCRYSPKIILDTGGTFEDTQRIIEWTANSYYLSSDYYFGTSYEGATNPYDTATCWGNGDSYDWGCPSPYLNDGSKNPLYSQVYDNGSGIGNRAEEMDGRVNTSVILAIDNSVSTSWQTASTIVNNTSTSTNTQPHTAAQCCWRYHTVGTNQGDWYLPSSGELGYLCARWKAINNSIDKLVSSGVEALVLPVSYSWWSSTEYSSGSAVNLYFYSSYAYLDYGSKNYDGRYVRAFLAV